MFINIIFPVKVGMRVSTGLTKQARYAFDKNRRILYTPSDYVHDTARKISKCIDE